MRPDGSRVYVFTRITDARSSQQSAIVDTDPCSPSYHSKTNTAPVPDLALPMSWDFVFSPDGSRLYLVDGVEDQVLILDTSLRDSPTTVGAITLGPGVVNNTASDVPSDVAVSPGGSLLLVPEFRAGEVSLIDLRSSPPTVDTIELGDRPARGAFSGDGQKVYVLLESSSRGLFVAEIDVDLSNGTFADRAPEDVETVGIHPEIQTASGVPEDFELAATEASALTEAFLYFTDYNAADATTGAVKRIEVVETDKGTYVYWTREFRDGDQGTSREYTVFEAELDESNLPSPVQRLVLGNARFYDVKYVESTDTAESRVYLTHVHAVGAGRENIERALPEQQSTPAGVVAVPGPPRALDYDSVSKKLYWCDLTSTSILRADLDGSDVETVYTAPSFDAPPHDVALDAFGGKMYWIERKLGVDGEDTIWRADLCGLNPEPVMTGLQRPESLALDPQAGRLYWSDVTENAIYGDDDRDEREGEGRHGCRVRVLRH